MAITTHVLDVSLGQPARGVRVRLEREDNGAWELVGDGETNADGRVTDPLAAGTLVAAMYRITWETGAYFAASHRPTFYPSVAVIFAVTTPIEHYHVPLLVSPFGFSTYRGS